MISETRRATWQRLLAEQQASGLSVVAWCFQQDIREQTFYYWRKRLSKPTVPPAATTPHWLALDSTSAEGLRADTAGRPGRHRGHARF